MPILTTTSSLDQALVPILTRIQAGLLALDNEPLSFSRIYGRLPVKMVRGIDAVAAGKDEKPRRLPIYRNAELNKNEPVVPDEKQGGLVFCITTAPAKPVDWTPGVGIFGGTYQSDYPLALIAWWNSQNGPTVDEVRATVLSELGKSFDVTVTGVEDQLATRVFRDLDYDFNNHTYLLYPNEGIRIEFTLTVRENLNC